MSSPLSPARRPRQERGVKNLADPAARARPLGDLVAHAGHPAYDNGTCLGVLLEEIKGRHVAATLSQ